MASNNNVVSDVFESADLPEGIATTLDRYMPQKNFILFIDAAARAVGDRNFGLFLAPHLTVADYGDWGRYLVGATTLEQALFRSVNAMKFHASHDRLHIVPSGDEVAFIIDVPVRGVVGYQHFAVCAASVMVSLVRAYTGANWDPLRVEFDFPRPPSLTPHEDLFCCKVLFDRPRIAVIIERNALSYSPVSACGKKTVTYSDLRRIAERPAPTDLVSMVKETIRLKLMDGAVDINRIGAFLALGPRTLQRRLNDEGAAFRPLVSQVRAERALELLRETEIPMIDIAVELGYSSSSHFSRAFRKTVGLLPSDIRRGGDDAVA